MRRLGDTISRLTAALPSGIPGNGPARLAPLPPVASNPGELDAWYFIPECERPVAMVVVLHGCTQTAIGYDQSAGWSELGERHGFAVLLPGQRRANNLNLCFNWFSSADNSRGVGEARSIREMIMAMVDHHAVDAERVFITGLSAGGAMASVMLASYPEIFSGGAIIAGLPFGAAATLPAALERMRGQGHFDNKRYAAIVREASTHTGRWPTISVWHGDADRTVAPNNADAIIDQWRLVHGGTDAPAREEMIGRARHRVWQDRDGRDVVEDYRIAGMGHGTPLSTEGDTACGQATAYMLDVGISSTWHIASAWGLIDLAATMPASQVEPRVLTPALPQQPVPMATSGSIQTTIETALRAAGLMR